MVERTFLTKSSSWRNFVQPGELTTLGYLSKDPKRQVSVEIVEILGRDASPHVAKAQITIIQPPKVFNYLIPIEEARELLIGCADSPLSYTKYMFGISPRTFGADPQVWYVKEFTGPYIGYVLTGVELKEPSEQIFPPDWVGTEVTEDPKYQLYNLGEFLIKG